MKTFEVFSAFLHSAGVPSDAEKFSVSILEGHFTLRTDEGEFWRIELGEGESIYFYPDRGRKHFADSYNNIDIRKISKCTVRESGLSAYMVYLPSAYKSMPGESEDTNTIWADEMQYVLTKDLI